MHDLIGHIVYSTNIKIRANGPCTNKTGARTGPGQKPFWAKGLGCEKCSGEWTAIPLFTGLLNY